MTQILVYNNIKKSRYFFCSEINKDDWLWVFLDVCWSSSKNLLQVRQEKTIALEEGPEDNQAAERDIL